MPRARRPAVHALPRKSPGKTRSRAWRTFAATVVLLPLLAVLPQGGAAAQLGQSSETTSVPLERAAPPPSESPTRQSGAVIDGEGESAAAGAPTIGGIVSVGLNQEISRLFTDSNFIPPDTMGAVGPRHIIEMINGNFQIFDKTTGASLDSRSLDGFWTTIAGRPIINDGRFDPRLLYDPLSQRWFAVSIDGVIDADDDNVNEAANNVFVARSDTDDPTGDWDGVSFNADSVGVLEFHDYPTLGLDAEGLYICTQDFDGGGNESCYSIPKVDLLAATPTVANLTRFEATPAGLPAVTGSWQPAVNYGLSLGRAPVLGSDGDSLLRTDVFGAAGPGAFLGTATAIAGDPGHAGPGAARQPLDFAGEAVDLENVAPRFVGNVVVVGGSLWAAHAVEGDAAGANSAIRWYEIDEATNTVLQTALIEHADFDYHEPSIAVNQFGDVVIGYTCSGRTLPASVCASVGQTSSGVTTFQLPAVLFAGTGVYYRDFCDPADGCGERNRWGDYSATVVDPDNPCTFWTFQEYTAQGAGNVDVGPDPEAEGGFWGTRVVELRFDGCVFTPEADLQIQKTDSPDPVTAGNNLTYVITVTNNGPSAAADVVVSDLLSADLAIVSVTANGGGSCNAGVPGSVATSCAFGNVLNTATRTMTVVARVAPSTPDGTVISNNASVSSSTADPDNANNLASSATSVLTSADLSITKSDVPDPVIAGANLTYSLSVTNGGPSWARDVVVTDPLPAQVAFVSAAVGGGAGACIPSGASPTTVTCTLGDLADGAVRTITIVGTVSPATADGATLSNTATVSSSTNDPDAGDNADTEATSVITQADIWVDKTAQQLTGNPSRTIRFTLAVYNKPGCEADDALSCGAGGPSDAQNVVVTDTLPLDPKKLRVVFVSQNCAYDQALHQVQCSVAGGTLPAGQLATFIVDVQPIGNVGSITNTVSATSSTTDPTASNNTDEVQFLASGGSSKR